MHWKWVKSMKEFGSPKRIPRNNSSEILGDEGKCFSLPWHRFVQTDPDRQMEKSRCQNMCRVSLANKNKQRINKYCNEMVYFKDISILHAINI